MSPTIQIKPNFLDFRLIICYNSLRKQIEIPPVATPPFRGKPQRRKMSEFITILLSGSWLIDFWSWIWNSALVGTTKWMWGGYAALDPGLLAVIVFILALVGTLILWTYGLLLLYGLWIYAALGWLIILFVAMIVIFCIWVWPGVLWLGKAIGWLIWWIIKIFMIPVMSSLLTIEIASKSKWWSEPLVVTLIITFIFFSLAVLPLGWAVIYIGLYILYLHAFSNTTPVVQA